MRYMSPDYARYGGALQVYQPNATEVARHRYMSSYDLVHLGEETVIKSLVIGVSAYDIAESSSMDNHIRHHAGIVVVFALYVHANFL